MNENTVNVIWNFIWENLYYPKTSLLYDRKILDDENNISKDVLPTPEEIKKQIPNPCGWGTDMEDSMINGGVMLETIVNRYEATGETEMKSYAEKILAGIKLCTEISDKKGFLARSVSPLDGKSYYINSSRDQYTHVISSLVRYFECDMCTESEKELIKKILVGFAEGAEEDVIEETDYHLLRADGHPGLVTKMWGKGVWPHEINRLHMIYIAAWVVSGDEHWLDMYKKYRDEGLRIANEIDYNGVISFAMYGIFQMQVSLRLIYDYEPDAEYKEMYLDILKRGAAVAKKYRMTDVDKYSKDKVNEKEIPWRKRKFTYECESPINGYGYFVPYSDLLAYLSGLRNISEALFIQTLCPGETIPKEQIENCEKVLELFDFEKHTTYYPIGFMASYWSMKRNNTEIKQ